MLQVAAKLPESANILPQLLPPHPPPLRRQSQTASPLLATLLRAATATHSRGVLSSNTAAISATITVYEPLAATFKHYISLKTFLWLWDFCGSRSSNNEGNLLWQQSSNKGS